MNEALTGPFTLGPPPEQARGAVLLLHGFTGSPWEMRPLGEALAARGFHAHAPLLAGHGRTPEAMLFAGAREWLACAEAALSTLQGARRVSVAGLSMGALLAMILGARYREQVRALVLLAPAVKLKGRRVNTLKALRRVGVDGVLPEWVHKKGLDLEDRAAAAGAPALPRYPSRRLFDLFSLQELAGDLEYRLTCPSLVVTAVNDHIIDNAAAHALSARLPFSQAVSLQRGFHQVLRDSDRATAISAACSFLVGSTP